jgi:hypothetical protein
MPPRTLNDAEHWRDRAAEMRTLADEYADQEAARMMRRLADDYDKLAERANERAKDDPNRRTPSALPKHERR